MRLETFVGLRFLRAKRQHRTISIITWISMGGVMLGVTALIVTISVMNGFRHSMFLGVMGTSAHLRVEPARGEWMGPDAQKQIEQALQGLDGVEATAPYFSRPALLAFGEEYRAVLLRGIDPVQEAFVGLLADHITRDPFAMEDTPAPTSDGPLDTIAYPPPAGQRSGILLGASLASGLGVLPGDEVRLISPVQRMTPIGAVPLIKAFRVAGIFATGISGTDDVTAFVDLSIAQRLYRAGNNTNGVAVRMADPHAIPRQALLEAAPESRLVLWSDENKNIFQVMRLEKVGVFLILTLIILVSFFNIIGSLIMLVLEKRKAIAVLMTLGLTESTVRRIFFYQGIWIGVVGTLGGLALGLTICWALATFDIITLPPGVFPTVNRLPVSVEVSDLVTITAASFIICALVTLYPATRATRVRPVDNLRYE